MSLNFYPRGRKSERPLTHLEDFTGVPPTMPDSMASIGMAASRGRCRARENQTTSLSRCCLTQLAAITPGVILSGVQKQSDLSPSSS